MKKITQKVKNLFPNVVVLDYGSKMAAQRDDI